jgi:hypothetical protein
MEGLLEGGETRNASTRVAGKVGWPVNWCPMLEICFAAYAAKDEYKIMVVDVVMVDYNMDLNALKGNSIIFCRLGIFIFD